MPEEVYLLKESHQFFAFHTDTDDQIVNTLQGALETLKSSGELDRIIQKYLAVKNEKRNKIKFLRKIIRHFFDLCSDWFADES